ncbi:MAG: hypothetical protein ACRDYZ_16550 [Acidimicrobiales bacterium]
MLIGSADKTLEDAQPSPNGKLLAYVRATCARSEVVGLIGQHCPTTVTHPWSTMLFTDSGRGVHTVVDWRHAGPGAVLSKVSW